MLNSDVKLIDNIISKSYADEIENDILHSKFPFYYISDVTVNGSTVTQKSMSDGKPVVQIDLDLTYPVDDAIFRYIVD